MSPDLLAEHEDIHAHDEREKNHSVTDVFQFEPV